MVAPNQERGSQGPTFEPLEIADEARTARLQRRAAGLERQLEARIAEIARLRERLAHHEAIERATTSRDSGAQQEHDVLRQKAAEYDALMRTLTMRGLRLPRTWYAAARRRLPGRHPRPGGYG